MTPVRPVFALFGEPTDIATSAKQLHIERIDQYTMESANHDWHSQLPNIQGLAFGDVQLFLAATYAEGIYGVAAWTRPVAANRLKQDTAHLLELRRLAIPDYAPKYTATRMLGRMRRYIRINYPEVCTLVSYQVTDVHTGTIYKAANWTLKNEGDAYTHWTNRPGRKPGQNISPKNRWELTMHPCTCDQKGTP